MSDINYLDKNRQSWNSRVDYHVKSDFYDLEGFLKGNTSLNEIELNLLGDVRGLSILHLQCHFGQDTISLARLGAKVTGVDLSNKSIEIARDLANQTHVDATFICSDIYELPGVLDKQYDMVFTSYGTIGWLPDLDKWAKIITGFLKPGGRFVFADFHPTAWMFDENFEIIKYDYFNTGPIVEIENGTYADKDAPITHEYITWNHSVSEILNNLIGKGLQIQSLHEYDYSPYNVFTDMVEFEPKKFRIKGLERKVPIHVH